MIDRTKTLWRQGRALILALGLGACADAEGTLSVQNDLFLGGTDRHYTNGLFFGGLARVEGLRGEESLRAVAGALLPGDAAARPLEAGIAFGQQMYTPADILQRPPDPRERPYAGWLFTRLSLVAADSGRQEAAERSLPAAEGPRWQKGRVDRFDLDLGIVGPYSLAADTQRAWHDIIGVAKPLGWGSQLGNEPGLIASWEHSRPLRRIGAVGGLDLELTPHATASLGNILTFAGLGATVRLGRNLPDLLGAPLLRSIGGTLPERGGRDFGWYVFAGFEGRAVARNMFLDGNTFRDSPHVDRSPFVGDLQVGAGLLFRGVRLNYVQVFRSREFNGQDFGDSFGSVLLSFPLGW